MPCTRSISRRSPPMPAERWIIPSPADESNSPPVTWTRSKVGRAARASLEQWFARRARHNGDSAGGSGSGDPNRFAVAEADEDRTFLAPAGMGSIDPIAPAAGWIIHADVWTVSQRLNRWETSGDAIQPGQTARRSPSLHYPKVELDHGLRGRDA